MAATPGRTPRSDARSNRAALLAAASRILVGRGPSVTLAVVAAEAGVGIGTLYRNFADREALFDAVSVRSYELIESFAAEAAASTAPALDAIGRFFDHVLEHRDDLALPLLGVPAPHRESVVPIGQRLSALLDQVLERGRRDGSVRPDARSIDLIIAGAMLAQPHLRADVWNAAARRIRTLLLDGLRTDGGRSPMPRGLTRRQLDARLAGQAGAS